MVSSIKRSLQDAIAPLSDEECVQVMEFVQNLQNQGDEWIDEDQTDDPFEDKNGILVLKKGSIDPETIKSALQRDREARNRKLMSW